MRAVARQVADRASRAADLDERDPDYIREQPPGLWLLASPLLPRRGPRARATSRTTAPVLLVGNHSGGNMTPDTNVFTLAFTRLLRRRAAFHQLAHNLVLSMPGLGFLRKFGTVAASPRTPRRRSQPGPRCSSTPAATTRSTARAGSATRSTSAAARASSASRSTHDVPIVPIVSIGGQETALFLSRGEGLAKMLMLDRFSASRCCRSRSPSPWGLNVGDMLGHFPLPAKITVEALPPIHLREEFGDEPDVDEVYEHVHAADAGDPRRALRRAHACRCSDEDRRADRDLGPPAASLGVITDPARYLHFMSGDDALGGRRRRQGHGDGRALPRY